MMEVVREMETVRTWSLVEGEGGGFRPKALWEFSSEAW